MRKHSSRYVHETRRDEHRAFAFIFHHFQLPFLSIFISFCTLLPTAPSINGVFHFNTFKFSHHFGHPPHWLPFALDRFAFFVIKIPSIFQSSIFLYQNTKVASSSFDVICTLVVVGCFFPVTISHFLLHTLAVLVALDCQLPLHSAATAGHYHHMCMSMSNVDRKPSIDLSNNLSPCTFAPLFHPFYSSVPFI